MEAPLVVGQRRESPPARNPRGHGTHRYTDARGAGFSGALPTVLAGRTLSHSHAILAEFGLLAVAGLAAIAAGAVLTGSFGRMLAEDLASLAAAAEQLAGPPVP